MIKIKRTKERTRQCKCYLCGQEGHIRPECSELKKPSNERSRKTQAKINLINEYQVDSEEEELISELDFESENSSVYSIDDNEPEIEEICMIIEKRKINQRKLL